MNRYQRAIPATGPSSSDRNGLPPGGGYTWRGKPDLRKVNAAIVAARTTTPLRMTVPVTSQHGTRTGYQRHMRSHEAPCEPCRHANTDATRQQRKRVAA